LACSLQCGTCSKHARRHGESEREALALASF
jgi:bacterioferritin-associated ferredoxin